MADFDVLGAILFVTAWMIVGAIVAETVRIWFGLWWLRISFSVLMLWPFVLFLALFGRNHDQ